MRSALIAVTIALIASLASCRPEGTEDEVLMTFTDIATFEGNNAPGKCARFAIRKEGDSPIATLSASFPLPDSFIPGRRYLIRYTHPLNAPYSSGQIELLGASAVTQGKVEAWKEEYAGWQHDPVWVTSVWRTGSWINLNMRLPYSEAPRVFTLAAAPEGVTPDGVVELRLVHILPAGTPESFMRTYYASFDISETWADPTVKAINLTITNSNLPTSQFQFVKIP